MRKYIGLFLCLVLIGCSWLPFIGDGDPERMTIVFHEGSFASGIMAFAEKNIELISELDIIDGIVCNLTPRQQKWVDKLLDVKYMEPDIVVSILDVPQPLVAQEAEILEAEKIPWGVERINAPSLWPEVTGRGVRVGVIDTGVYTGHPDLIGFDGVLAVRGGFNAIDGGSYEDDNNHGTYIATILAARENGVGIIGVAPDAELYAIKVLSASGSGYSSDVVKGYQWALDQDLKIVNLSLGSYWHSQSMRDAMVAAAWQGMGTICAAGNDGQTPIIYPAKDPVAVCVGATGLNDTKMSWSNWGPALQLNGVMAPGNWILAGNKEGGWQRIAGTSAATPHVTGLVALLEDVVKQSWAERRFIFAGASQPIYPTEEMGHGLIDCLMAYQIMLEEVENVSRNNNKVLRLF